MEDTPRRTCSAVIGLTVGGYGFDRVMCKQSVAVRSFVTTGNVIVGFCPRIGHEANVRSRFPEKPEPPEPEWDLPDGPDHADSMTFAAWFADREKADVQRFGP